MLYGVGEGDDLEKLNAVHDEFETGPRVEFNVQLFLLFIIFFFIEIFLVVEIFFCWSVFFVVVVDGIFLLVDFDGGVIMMIVGGVGE